MGAFRTPGDTVIRKMGVALAIVVLASFFSPTDATSARESATAVSEAPSPVYRFYKTDGSHFYTRDAREKNQLETTAASTYTYEGIAFVSYATQIAGTVPVYRFYNFREGVHFYTANQTEYQTLLDTAAATYRYEGVAYFAEATPVADSVPVYRFYKFRQGVHFYTTNATEAEVLRRTASSSYREEGVAYRVPTTLTFSGIGPYRSEPFVPQPGLNVTTLTNVVAASARMTLVGEDDWSCGGASETDIRLPGERMTSFAFSCRSESAVLEVRTSGAWSVRITFPRSASGRLGEFTGSGVQASPLFAVTNGESVIRYSIPPETAYLTADILDVEGRIIDRVVGYLAGHESETSPPTGSVAVDLPPGNYVLQVIASGPWAFSG